MATDYICMIYVCCFVTHAYTQRSNMLLSKEILMQRPNKLHNKTPQPVEEKIQLHKDPTHCIERTNIQCLYRNLIATVTHAYTQDPTHIFFFTPRWTTLVPIPMPGICWITEFTPFLHIIHISGMQHSMLSLAEQWNRGGRHNSSRDYNA